MIYLDTLAPERGTYVIDVPFTDENGDGVTPNSITWTLTDINGVVVNSRSAVVVATPGTSISIVLSGLDLAVGGNLYGTARKLLVEAVYDSDIGNDLPLKEEIEFNIQDFTALTGIT